MSKFKFPRGWTVVGGDDNWQDYGGTWLRRESEGEGVYWRLEVTNLDTACGADNAGHPEWIVEARRLDMADLSDGQVAEARRSCGWIGAPETPEAIAEACFAHGFGAPMFDTTAPRGPRGSERHLYAAIRAVCRDVATAIKDEAVRAARLDRPVNRIGSTAAEYGRGDLLSALDREPIDETKALMRRLHGLPW